MPHFAAIAAAAAGFPRQSTLLFCNCFATRGVAASTVRAIGGQIRGGAYRQIGGAPELRGIGFVDESNAAQLWSTADLSVRPPADLTADRSHGGGRDPSRCETITK